MTGKEMVKLLLRKGWNIDRIRGSHYVLECGCRTIVVPVHTKELGKGLEARILKEAGLK